MANFSFSDAQRNTADSIDLETFAALTKGSSIVSMSADHDALRISLSAGVGFTLRAKASGELEVVAYSDPNSRYISGTRIKLLDDSEEPFAGIIQPRLWSVTQVYALIVLVESAQIKEAARGLKGRQNLESLLPLDERLLVIGAGQGSFVVDLATKVYEKARRAPGVALNAISLVFGEGRTLVLRQVRAGTRVKEAQAGMKEAELQKYRLDAVIDAVNKISKIEDAEAREMIRRAFLDNLKAALGPTDPLLKLLPA